MSETVTSHTANVPEVPELVDRVVNDFVDTARNALGHHLHSIVLYGSAAEGKLRPTSDVNLIVILATFEQTEVDRLREPLRVAHAAIQLHVMFLLEEEIGPAAEAFAQKFADILRRRRVLYGEDPFMQVSIPRRAILSRLQQVLLNLTLRLRQSYVLQSLREEQLALVIADVAGPLRSCAATLLDLEQQRVTTPKEALQRVVASLDGSGWKDVLAHLSEARERRPLPPGVAGPTLLRLIDLTRQLQTRVKRLA